MSVASSSGALSGWAEVVAADGLAEAREILARKRPDLILLDIGLHDGDGADLLVELEGEGDPPPVIVFTAQDTSRDLGPLVVDVLIKSKTPLSELVGAVRALLKPQEAA